MIDGNLIGCIIGAVLGLLICLVLYFWDKENEN